jgi:L-lactate dehydrogenase complex protein LldF
MDIHCNTFPEQSRKALQDRTLGGALKLIESRIAHQRNVAFAQLENGEALRDQAHSVKKQTLSRLGPYLEALEKNVQNLGGHVHWAEDAEQARSIVHKIALDNGVKRIVKGKSMATEEIALNRHLIREGMEVSETDLGEFIIQLAEEPPSHIVGPAIHKTKEQVSELFSRVFGVERMKEPEEMTLFARRILRERFLKADMGITGVNFAVAETGTVVLFENEGNIRLTTTLPKVHVAIMGMEKVIPTMEDLSLFTKLLPRSTTGQKLCTYVSLINGIRRTGEGDGADVFHLIILDNGRSRILADEECREALHCIHCGACFNFCPVYLKIGGHAYGWVYSGPIGSVLSPLFLEGEPAYPLPFASTLCGACAEVCPVKINIPRILVALRRRFAENPDWGHPQSLIEKGLIKVVSALMSNPGIYGMGLDAARILQKPIVREDRFTSLSSSLVTRARLNQASPLARRSFRRQWKEIKKENK